MEEQATQQRQVGSTSKKCNTTSSIRPKVYRQYVTKLGHYIVPRSFDFKTRVLSILYIGRKHRIVISYLDICKWNYSENNINWLPPYGTSRM